MKIDVREIPSIDDKGDWYIFIGGVRLATSYWSKEQADAAAGTLRRFLDNRNADDAENRFVRSIQAAKQKLGGRT